MKSVQSSSTVKTRSPEQSIVGHETQWTQPLQNATVRDNILFGKPQNEILYSRAIECCALAGDFARRRPDRDWGEGE